MPVDDSRTAEAAVGGPIALVEDGDVIEVDVSPSLSKLFASSVIIKAVKNTLELEVSADKLEQRRKGWKPRPPPITNGYLWKYIQLVADASHGAVTGMLLICQEYLAYLLNRWRNAGRSRLFAELKTMQFGKGSTSALLLVLLPVAAFEPWASLPCAFRDSLP